MHPVPCRHQQGRRPDETPDKWDQPLLDELARAMGDASICGLGQAAPNVIQCVIKYFPHELSK